MIKKLLSLALSTAVLVCSLSGCGQDIVQEDSQSQISQTESHETQENQPKEENSLDLSLDSPIKETENSHKKPEEETKKEKPNHYIEETQKEEPQNQETQAIKPFSLDDVPEFSGNAYVAINNNVPYFTDFPKESFEHYGELDSFGRCTAAFANVGKDLMPTEKRGSIGQVKPTGWQTIKYDFVDGKYLYNRCHLIGYQLTAENANPKNLVTGTRYLNIEGMLPFENMVADYVKETNGHVLYRVTPVFKGNNLVCDGVLMEGYSVEDQGEGICFCVFAYNAQPGAKIDYSSGKSTIDESYFQEENQAEPKAEPTAPLKKDLAPDKEESPEKVEDSFILNTNTKKFHYPTCKSVKKIKPENYEEFNGTREELISKGYSPCGNCTGK